MKTILRWQVRVQKVGNSCMVTLPKLWCQAKQVDKGDMLQLAVTSTGDLLISPSGGGGDG